MRDHGDAGQHIGLKVRQHVAGFGGSQRITHRQPFGFDAAAHARAFTPEVRHQTNRGSRLVRFADGLLAQTADAFAFDILDRQVGTHQHVRQPDHLDRGIPTVHIKTRIGLGDAQVLGVFHAIGVGQTVLDGFENHGAGGIRHATKTLELRGGQRLAEQRVNRAATHERRFKQEPNASRRRQCLEFVVRVNHRPFVGRDDMTTAPEPRTNVVNRGLPGVWVQARGFKHHVRL